MRWLELGGVLLLCAHLSACSLLKNMLPPELTGAPPPPRPVPLRERLIGLPAAELSRCMGPPFSADIDGPRERMLYRFYDFPERMPQGAGPLPMPESLRSGIDPRTACSNDPDCPKKDLPSGGGTSPAPPNAHASRPEDVDDCTSTEDSEITEAIDWGAENWTAYDQFLEDIDDWPVSIGNCLENRFKDNGTVVCEKAVKGMCKENLGWASPLNRKCHMCPNWLTDIRAIPGKSNRQACYFAMLTHEWGHTCERGHKTLEIIDGEAFEFWKSRHPDVDIVFSECGEMG